VRYRLRELLERFLRGGASGEEQPRRPGRRREPRQEPRLGEGRPRPADALEEHGLPDTEIGHVTVEYEPCLDGDPDPGEVVWAWVPFEEDPTQGKDRPLVIIGRAGRYLAGVALTTKGSTHPDNVEIGRGPWDDRGRTSYAKLDRVLRIDPGQMRREGAVLDRDRFTRLIEALREHG